jgi:hypothetical protein
MVNKHKEKCSLSHAIMRLQIQQYRRYQYKLMKIVKKSLTPNTGEDVEQQEISYTVSENAK